MRKLAAAIAGLLLAAASSAAAQDFADRARNLGVQIEADEQSGRLSQEAAARLRAALQELLRLEARYRETYGLSLAERNELERRYQALQRRLAEAAAQ